MSDRSKPQLRIQLIRARRLLAPAAHEAEALALAQHIPTLPNISGTVCAYVPIGTEPGSVALLEALQELAERVLLPVAVNTSDGVPLPLLWGEYRPGELVAARFGLMEPAGPSLPAETLSEAALVIVPALAVDHHGGRLGRGAGFYDRSLPLRDPAAHLVAVVRDEELVAELPVAAHDVRMTHAVTPGGGVVTLEHREWRGPDGGSST
ncbi:5-formyltetrahydrofolate cyclo-ligase [Mycolicibacterium komossense]|uniref:5-formyltetrahydrofolate cyclo-ligase n=1 Tax=Mycolicibacterium komossense TaxID=1779 RepID=UPI0027E2B2F5|nr:5-formyltetrahydrofolate cyclo-ligase [Mycolicibacterium komossense]